MQDGGVQGQSVNKMRQVLVTFRGRVTRDVRRGATSLRSWVFEGSTNLLDWTVLREHGNDSSLTNPWAS